MNSQRKKKQATLNDLVEIPSKRRKSDDSTDPEQRAGTIKAIVLKNFMCHSFLEVKFEAGIYYVVGQNGSGKSAILTALIVGLGGKANLTNRGSSIKEFIKAGTNSCTIEITIHNLGPLAYRSSSYGSSITIIRHVAASGSNSYKIKSDIGTIVSTQAIEVHNITNYLNIQVDNPICILNQDTSRNFLSSTNPKNTYTLFLRATNLEELILDYEKVKRHKEDAVEMFDDRLKYFRSLEQNINDLRQKIDQHKSAADLLAKTIELRVEQLWAKVKEAESELTSIESRVSNLENKCSKFTSDTSQRTEEINKLNEHIQKTQKQLTDLKSSIDIKKQSYNDTNTALERLMTLYNDKKREKQRLVVNIDEKNKDITTLEEEIAKYNENLKQVKQRKEEQAKRIDELEKRIKSTCEILETARNELYQIKMDIERKNEDCGNFRREINAVDRQIEEKNSKLHSLKSESGNSLLLYGREIPRVCQMIEQNRHKFKQLPRGPLGNYIKLRDKKWAVAIEEYLGKNMLASFVVDNQNDGKLLEQIFNQAGVVRKPNIITTKFFSKIHDVSRNLVVSPPDCVAFFNILEFDDPVVANVIIDQSSIESILLIPNDDLAMKLLSQRSVVPRNCMQALTLKGDRYYPDPNFRTYAGRGESARFLQVDTKQYILELEQAMSELKNQKKTLFSQYQSLEHEIKVQKTKQNEVENKLRKLQTNRSEMRENLDRLRTEPELEIQSAETLTAEIEEIKKVILEKQAKLDQLNVDLNEIKTTKIEIETRSRQSKDELNALQERYRPLPDIIKTSNEKIKQIQINGEYEEKKLNSLKEKLIQAQTECGEKLNQIEKLIIEADTVGKRPDKIRNFAEITEELETTERILRKTQTEAGNLEQIMSEYEILLEKYTQIKEVLKILKEVLSELKNCCVIRKRFYTSTEMYFRLYIKHAFKKVLECGKFKGSLSIDSEQKTLNIRVMPQEGSQGATSTSNLSGGERSFSTVAFLFSLWQCMDFPFYILDEFDVYMDKLNRTKVFEILTEYALEKSHLQYVFLTPQDVSFANSKVKVLKLSAPERING